jgi:hypothetical protein
VVGFGESGELAALGGTRPFDRIEPRDSACVKREELSTRLLARGDAQSACQGYADRVSLPAVGSHVRIVGTYEPELLRWLVTPRRQSSRRSMRVEK